MQIISDRKEKIFRNDYNGKPIYKIGLSKKNQEGNYVNGYMLCSFKKSVDIKDKTYIKIKSAWLDFYLKDKDDKKETVPYIFINDYEEIEDDKKEVEVIKVESKIGEEFDYDTPDLPF